jgi:hypothetical protein
VAGLTVKPVGAFGITASLVDVLPDRRRLAAIVRHRRRH